MRRLVVYNLLLIIAFTIFSCNGNYYLTSSSYHNYPVDKSLAGEDPKIVSFYEPYKEALDKKMSKVVGVSSAELKKDKPESSLTNFLGDLLLAEGDKYLQKTGENFKADVSYFNYGGIRTFIPKGNITVENIYELMPFENEMVFVKLKGADLKQFLDHLARNGGDSVGGVRFGISDNKAADIRIGGKPFDINSEYWLVTNDYVAGGGDDMSVMKNRVQYISSGVLIRDAIIDYLETMHNRGEVITPKLDGRIYHE